MIYNNNNKLLLCKINNDSDISNNMATCLFGSKLIVFSLIFVTICLFIYDIKKKLMTKLKDMFNLIFFFLNLTLFHLEYKPNS